MRPKLPCDVCGRDLARLDDLRRGWVSWWTKVGSELVEHFHVTCAGTLNPCLDVVDAELKPAGYFSLDHHLSVFTGRNAMPRMRVLLWDYEWKHRSRAHERMLNFFAVAELLPTTKHGTECRGLEL